LKTSALGTDGVHAAIRLRAAECKAVANPFFLKEFTMFFAPVVRTRAVAPGSRSFDRSFERFVNEAFFNPATQGVNVQQDEKAWTVTLDLPGVTREELSIATEGNVVRIETKAEAKRQYKAAYELPQDIDVAASGAALENGVLTLTLAKQVPVSNVKQIEIK
jgi:HSP20 family protein